MGKLLRGPFLEQARWSKQTPRQGFDQCGRDADVWPWLLSVCADEWMCSARFVGASFSTTYFSSRLVGASRRRVRLRSSVRVEKGMEWFNCLMGWRLGSCWKRANTVRAREPATKTTEQEPETETQYPEPRSQNRARDRATEPLPATETQEPDQRIQKRSQSQQRQHSQSKRASDRDNRARAREPETQKPDQRIQKRS